MNAPLVRAMLLGGLLAVTQADVMGQFKSSIADKPGVSESILRPETSESWFGLFDPGRFSMRHTFSMSYATFGGGRGMSLGMYTNSMYYKIADPLDVQFDVSLMYSPNNSLMGGPQKDFAGIYLTRAQLNYRPSENMMLQINFQQVPVTSLMWGTYGYSPFSNFGFSRTQEGH